LQIADRESMSVSRPALPQVGVYLGHILMLSSASINQKRKVA